MNNKKNWVTILLTALIAVLIDIGIVYICWNYCLSSVFNLPHLNFGRCMLLTIGITGLRYTLFFPIQTTKK